MKMGPMANHSPPPKRKTLSSRRRLFVPVKTAKGRRVSSKLWLERQLNDPYVLEAKRQGYRCRSAFKLLELDGQERFLKPGLCVVDLGASPGGWSQVLAQKTQSELGKGKVVAIDLHGLEPIAGVTFFKADFLEPEAEGLLMTALNGRPVDVVVSDMATHATGHRRTDHVNNIALCETALDFAFKVLVPGGVFICKVLQGGTQQALLADIKRAFKTVKHIKPPSSRKESSELFLYAKGYRPDHGLS